ncbi:MAG: glycosyltransferase family 10 [Pirellulaceae bacterium]
MKPHLKLAFVDFSQRTFAAKGCFLYKLLEPLYDLELADDPQVVFYSCFGQAHRRYRCRRIFYTGENCRPDWRACDYALSFDHCDRPEHYRLPNYARGTYGDLRDLIKGRADVDRILSEKTAFCNFIYSNRHCQERNQFFDRLARYKRIDSPGAVRNNMQGVIGPRFGGDTPWQVSKLAFLRRYKFTIAFENCSYPGYTTEKLTQPMFANSLPIYWGNPLVQRDFNPRSFLSYYDCGSQDELAERVIALDRDDSLYAECLRQPWLHGDRVPPQFEPESIRQFVVRAIETPRPLVAQRTWPSWFSGWPFARRKVARHAT